MSLQVRNEQSKRIVTSTEYHQHRQAYSRLGDYPSGTQENDDTKYVNHNRCEDTIPHPKQNWLGDKKLSLPPRFLSLKMKSTLENIRINGHVNSC